MKSGKCPMCGSTEVYMTDYFDTLEARGDNLHFQAMQDSDTAIYRFDTYVCRERRGISFLEESRSLEEGDVVRN